MKSRIFRPFALISLPNGSIFSPFAAESLGGIGNVGQSWVLLLLLLLSGESQPLSAVASSWPNQGIRSLWWAAQNIQSQRTISCTSSSHAEDPVPDNFHLRHLSITRFTGMYHWCKAYEYEWSGCMRNAAAWPICPLTSDSNGHNGSAASFVLFTGLTEPCE